jgi:hypothetical protein
MGIALSLMACTATDSPTESSANAPTLVRSAAAAYTFVEILEGKGELALAGIGQASERPYCTARPSLLELGAVPSRLGGVASSAPDPVDDLVVAASDMSERMNSAPRLG